MNRPIKIRSLLLFLATALVSVLVSVLATFLASGCTSLFYVARAEKVQFYDPARFGLHQEEIVFTDIDGVHLHAWWFAATTPTAKGTVVFFHGNGENLSTHFISLSWLPMEGYNYLIFDYPGYGFSQGSPSSYGNLMAGHAALIYVHEKKDPRPLIVYGQSLGGNIAYRTVLDIKDQVPIRALIVDGTFLSYRSIAREKASESALLWVLQPFAWLLMSDHYAPENFASRAPIPMLVIHGQKDPVVPPSFGEQVYATAAEPKEIWRIPNGVHGDTFWSNDHVYRKKFLEYIEHTAN